MSINWETDEIQIELVAVDKKTGQPLPQFSPKTAKVFSNYGQSQLRILQVISNLLGSDPFYILVWNKENNSPVVVIPVPGPRAGDSTSHGDYLKRVGNVFASRAVCDAKIILYVFGGDRIYWQVSIKGAIAVADDMDNMSDHSGTVSGEDMSATADSYESNGLRFAF